jgi:hypothetical protein
MITLFRLIMETDKLDPRYREMRYVAHHYPELPWPRLPCVGETMYFGEDADSKIMSVCFHPTNGNVIVEVEGFELDKSQVGYIDGLISWGLTETDDPWAIFNDFEETKVTSTRLQGDKTCS